MAHGGYSRRRMAPGRRSNVMGVDKKLKTKAKPISLKNQIRSIERMLRKELPAELREVQEKKLEEMKKQLEVHTRLTLERKIFLRDRKIKFFERRKIERRIRRLEKQQRSSTCPVPAAEISEQLLKLKDDLEYVRFYPKTEKYVSLFSGGEVSDVVDERNRMRKQIKANLIAAAASGKDLEETGSEDDGLLDLSDDDFFLSGSSSDEADADDEWTDKSAREQGSSASGIAASGLSSDEKNQMSGRDLMPPPRLSKRCEASTSKSSRNKRPRMCENNSSSKSEFSSKEEVSDVCQPQTGNIPSSSDCQKPRRKRRKKKQRA